MILSDVSISPRYRWRRQSVLPARQCSLRERCNDPDLQSRLCRMGRCLRRRRRCNSATGPAVASCCRHPNRGLKLPSAPACGVNAGTRPVQSPDNASLLRSTTTTTGQAAEKWPVLLVVRHGIIGEFYFGTFGEISSGIDSRQLPVAVRAPAAHLVATSASRIR